MKYHIIAMWIGFLLDLCLGDPTWLPHPVRWIGRWISFLEKKLYQETSPKRQVLAGICLWLLTLGGSVFVIALLLIVANQVHPYVALAVESVVVYQLLATKCLLKESREVKNALSHSLEEGRKRISYLVSRDVKHLEETGVVKATVETVAENTCDGIVAPMLFGWCFGPVGMVIYKAVNTLDSMVGYHNPRYEYFGKCSAKLDDVFNFIPARIAGIVMLGCGFVLGKEYSFAKGIQCFLQERNVVESPNAGQTESVCAGGLDIQLAGDTYYFGKLKEKPTINVTGREPNPWDITKVNRWVLCTSFVVMLLCTGIAMGLQRGY